MFFFTNDDYRIMKEHDWSVGYVIETLEDYASEYDLALSEVSTVFRFFGVSELFDGVRIGCEDLANMLGR